METILYGMLFIPKLIQFPNYIAIYGSGQTSTGAIGSSRIYYISYDVCN